MQHVEQQALNPYDKSMSAHWQIQWELHWKQTATSYEARRSYQPDFRSGASLRRLAAPLRGRGGHGARHGRRRRCAEFAGNHPKREEGRLQSAGRRAFAWGPVQLGDRRQATAQCFPSRIFPQLSSRPKKEQLLDLGFSAVVGLWLQEFDSKSSNFFNASKHIILKARRIITILIWHK